MPQAAHEPAADEPCVVLTTAPDETVARRIAEALVNEHLAACVNLLPGVTSIYRWQGVVEESRELLLVIKSTSHRLAELESALLRLHPYECPELVALQAAHVEPRYRAWLLSETR